MSRRRTAVSLAAAAAVLLPILSPESSSSRIADAAPSSPPATAKRKATTPISTTSTTSTTTSTTTTTAPPTTVSPSGATWVQTWADEFTNGLNPSWTAVTTGSGVFDDTWGVTCFQAGQVSVSNGSLLLTATRKDVTCNGTPRTYASGLVTTRHKFTQAYGRFEARMKMPNAKGSWPAWWLMPEQPVYGQWPGSGEIDVMEYVANGTSYVYETVHWGENGIHLQDATSTLVSGTPADWHRYALEWEPGELRWYVDDALVKTYRPASGGPPFDQPFYLVLNQTVGGEWPGPPDPAQYPSTVAVDWVRVWKRA